MTIRVTLNCPINPSKFQQLIPFLEKNLPHVRGFLGNQWVDVLFDENNNEMLLDEGWISVCAHQQYLSHIENNGVMAQLASFLSAAPEIKYFNKFEI